MKTRAIGVDLCDVERLARIIEQQGDRFLKKVFTESEIQYCQPKHSKSQCFAARFAAKEALLKAIGTGLRDGLNWKDIEIVNDSLGKPSFKLYNKCADLLNEDNILLSLSHVESMSIAFVIIDED